MINIVSEKNVLNGELVSKDIVNKIINKDKTGIYEVIRVINKKPTFLREHFDRLMKSIKLSSIDYSIDYNKFRNEIQFLIDNNEFNNCNIRVTYSHSDGVNSMDIILLYFIKSFYPDKSYYEHGIHTVIVRKERPNPNVKKNPKEYRDELDKIIREGNAFEAILVNHDNVISEGSKSNVFFVSGNNLITAPDEDVLLGVTRSKVLEIADDLNIKIVKRRVSGNELSSFDAAFITGTSNNVLPIKSIDNIKYDSVKNEVVLKLMREYENLLLQ